MGHAVAVGLRAACGAGGDRQPDDFRLLQAYHDGEDCGDLLQRYENPFHPPDRETEMRAAYDDFTRRLSTSESATSADGGRATRA
ncbi:MAG: hypothetical protein ACRDSZ_01745 [Pseudonocardiaceae bacterium]